MKQQAHKQAKDFTIADVSGKIIRLQDFFGRKIHLTFYRFSGCPNCNLRFHKIETLADEYRKNSTVSIAIFESSAESMRSHIADETFYAIMIPDEHSHLYKLYELEKSFLKLFYYLLFKNGIREFIEGKKLFRRSVKADGYAQRLEAEFLIDSTGNVVVAKYFQRQGDFIPVEEILTFIHNSR